MIHNNHQDCVKQQIMNAIEEGNVIMKPKWHFVLKTSLAVLGGVLIALALLYLVSFIIFVMWYTGSWFIPVYGIKGIISFLLAAPWLLVAVVVVFLWILETLFRHYTFAYRRPLLYSTLGMLGVVMIGGFTVAQTSLHQTLLVRAKNNKLPIAGPLYKQFSLRYINDIHRGMIKQIIENGFVISDKWDQPVEVTLTPETRFPYGTDFETGDLVVVFGEGEDGQITALGVHKVGSQRMLVASTSSQQMRLQFMPKKGM